MNEDIKSIIVDCLERKLGEKLIEKVQVHNTDMMNYENSLMNNHRKEVEGIRNALKYFEYEHGMTIADDSFLIERAKPVNCHMPDIIGIGRW